MDWNCDVCLGPRSKLAVNVGAPGKELSFVRESHGVGVAADDLSYIDSREVDSGR